MDYIEYKTKVNLERVTQLESAYNSEYNRYTKVKIFGIIFSPKIGEQIVIFLI